MLNVVCVKWGTEFGPEYVNILAHRVRANLPEGFQGKFICFTDDATGLDEGIEVRPLPGHLSGWWNKLYLFGAFNEGERVLYFDLDTLIVGPLDDIAKYDGHFTILRDFYRPDGLQSSVMAWYASPWIAPIYSCWHSTMDSSYIGGDQAWIQHCANSAIGPKPDILQDLYPHQFVSFKQSGGQFPQMGTRVVVFHGKPRPRQAPGWVQKVWSKETCTSLEIAMVMNTKREEIRANILHTLEVMEGYGYAELKTLPAMDDTAVIIGGGPSLKELLGEIRLRKRSGQTLIAVNGSYEYLKDHGIVADGQVIADARRENRDFILSCNHVVYLASHCHPAVFARARDLKCAIGIWHCNTAEAAALYAQGKINSLITAGSTVGLNAMALAFKLGFRRIHLYGLDSSFSDEAHAYQQLGPHQQDEIIPVESEGRHFTSNTWMVAQVQEFQTIAPALANQGCQIHVHGDGLLPWVAKHMMDGQFVHRHGDLWPNTDREAFGAVHQAVQDVELWLKYCKDKDVAVQAGGNVGLVPRRLAKDFRTVVTVEPDAANFHCLTQNLNGGHVIPVQGALGDRAGHMGLHRIDNNCGAHHMAEGEDITMHTIDHLVSTLPEGRAVDLIALDIEGYELPAIDGAIETITRYHPTVILEMKGLGVKFGCPDDRLQARMDELGYRQVDRIGRDSVFLHRTKEALHAH
jgi:FkbM family methyltransferase